MSTERQKQASRINGSRSRGPVTPAGKRNSSPNAVKHALLSGTVVLEGESTDRFLQLVAALHEEFEPQTPFEESLIENMAAARWRQMRIWGLEKAGMDHETRRQAGMPCSSASTEDSATRAALAFRALSDESRSLELIHRYDTRYERQYYRAHRRFLEVRDRRMPPSNEPDRPNQRPGGNPNEDSFPTGGTQHSAGARILEMPAPATPEETPAAGKKEVVFSKRTQEVTENTLPHSPGIRFDSHFSVRDCFELRSTSAAARAAARSSYGS
jgi:hypothetical protein